MIDYKNSFKQIGINTSEALQSQFPIKGSINTLQIKSIDITPPVYGVEEEEKAKFSESTLSTPVYAHMQLINNETGQIVDENKKFKMMNLPVATPRGSYMIKGNEYYVSMQNRRRSGIYPIRRDTGDVEAEFNIAKGAKNAPIMKFHPKKGHFILKIGQSEKALYPILKSIGVKDEQLIKAWGQDILNRNMQSPRVTKSTVLDTAYRLTGTKYKDVTEAGIAIKEKFGMMEMDKDVNKRTINRADEVVHPETLVDVSRRMLRINQGKSKPVDRNALNFKNIYHVEEFIPERIKLQTRKISTKIKYKLDKEEVSIKNIVTSGMFTGPVEKFFTGTSLSEMGSQHNPVDMVSSINKITSLGKGGIARADIVRDDMRSLHNSHAGFFDPIQTPESEKIGVNLHLAGGAVKRGKKLYTKVVNARTGKLEEVSHTDMADKITALPGSSWDPKKAKFNKLAVRAFKDGRIQEVPVKEIDYVHSKPQDMFSVATNMIPFLNSNSGARMFMAAKQYGQALNLIHREVPLVQAGTGSKGYEKILANASMTNARSKGVVSEVTDKHIEVTAENGTKQYIPLYKNFPLNNKHFLNTDKILVKRGQQVKKGQALIDNNFTKDGTLALGINLRTAYLADGGYNFEDGITISESASKKLTSEHLYDSEINMKDSSLVYNPKQFMAQKPNKISRAQASKLDELGIVKEGQILTKGDPIALALRKADLSAANQTMSQIGRKLKNPWRDASAYWDKPQDGVVTKIAIDKRGNRRIYIKTQEQAVIADKLAGRYGNKGVITRILPDKDMPRDKNGDHMEILLNPTGVPSRMNPGQQLETALAKVAFKRKRPIVVQSFQGSKANHAKQVADVLKNSGFDKDGKDELIDPISGKSIGRIGNGYQYILKLSKQAKTGASARSAGTGSGYDIDQAPKGGAQGGGKAMDILSIYALLAHGANSNLREMATDKASNNPEFWRMVKNGMVLPAPRTPFVYNKFKAYMKGSGVNMTRKGANINISPITDDDVLRSSSGEITNPKFIQAKTLKSIKNGFYDERITGGLSGSKWGHIELAEPVMNPVVSAGIREVLGKTEDELMDIIGTGGSAELQKMLKELDLTKLEKETQDHLDITNSPQIESNMNRRLHYIKALKKFKLQPDKAYMLKRYPVIPPIMRPINQIGDDLSVAQINNLYRDMLMVNNSMKDVNEKIPYLSNRLKGELRKDLQRSVAAVAGTVGPVGNYSEDRTSLGFIKQIKGKDKAKEGFFQKKVIKHIQDLSGRGVITPDPKLGIDEVALPEDLAWKIYGPFIERNLRRGGFAYDQIMDIMENKKAPGLAALQTEMKNRPVMLNRPPTLHKFGFMGFNSKLSNGNTIKIPSLVVKGFNADFDGDAMIAHVPVREEAIAEVRNKMMASKSLFNVRDDSPILVPSMEAVVGIFRASKTDAGMKKLKSIVPKEFHDLILPGEMNKKGINALLAKVGHDKPEAYKEIAQGIKLLGDETAFRTGFTLGLDDLQLKDPKIDALKKEVWAKVKAVGNDNEKKNFILAHYTKEMSKLVDSHGKNTFVEMMHSGGKGSGSNTRQIIGMPMQYTDQNKNPIPRPNFSNFAKGMGINDYWTSLFAARRSMIDRKMETADPGWFAKEMLINTSKIVTGKDGPLDDDGETFEVTDHDAFNRYIA